ncbi:hypothetical protein Tco_0439319 [Tanacetum coccineum]
MRNRHSSSSDDDDDDQQGDDKRTKYNNDKAADLNKTYDEEEDEFVHTPDDYVPNTKLECGGIDDEEMTDVGHVDVENENVNQQIASDQVNDVARATVIVALATQKTEVLLQSSSISSDYATKFLNFNNIPSADTKTISMMEIQVQQKIQAIKIEQAGKQQETKYTITSSDTAKLQEFDQEKILFETMTITKSFNKNTKHKALYHTLMESILKDEDAMDKGVVDKSKKRKPDDANRDEGPPAGSNQGLKRKKISKDVEPSKKAKLTGTSKGTTKSQPKSTGNDLAKAEKSSKTFNELMTTLIDFTAFAMNRLQISDLTKADLVFSIGKAFGGNTRNLGSFGKETDKTTDLHQNLLKIMLTERGHDVASIKRRRHDLRSDGISTLVTPSEHGRPKGTLEDSVSRD